MNVSLKFLAPTVTRAELDAVKKQKGFLERKLERKDAKIDNLTSLIDDLKERCLIEREPAEIMSQHFEGYFITVSIILLWFYRYALD